MRRTLGTAVFAGMLGVTLFGIFLTPVFYYVIQWFSDLRTRPGADGMPVVAMLMPNEATRRASVHELSADGPQQNTNDDSSKR
jgi:hypothetical protein